MGYVLGINNIRSGVVSVYPGIGDGTFSAPTTYSTDVGADRSAGGDFNGDGNLDVVTGGFTQVVGTSNVWGALVLLHGNKYGRFEASINTISLQPFAIIEADFNGDRILDIAVVNQAYCFACNGTVSVFLGTGKGYLAAPKKYSIGQAQGSISAGDVNGDGKTDPGGASIQISFLAHCMRSKHPLHEFHISFFTRMA